MRSVRFILAILIAATLLLAACGAERDSALITDDPGAVSFDYDYLIPLGTGDQIGAGEPVAILPAELIVRVGEVIRIVNEDDEGHFVGIFFVGAGETVTQRFASAGEFVGACSVHPSGQLTLEVLE